MPDLHGLLNVSHERQKSIALALAVLVILRSHIPTSLPKSLHKYTKRLSPEEVAQARQELYREEADGSITLLVPFRGRVSKVRVRTSVTPSIPPLMEVTHYSHHHRSISNQPKRPRSARPQSSSHSPPPSKAHPRKPRLTLFSSNNSGQSYDSAFVTGDPKKSASSPSTPHSSSHERSSPLSLQGSMEGS